jgi:hypothetical protein
MFKTQDDITLEHTRVAAPGVFLAAEVGSVVA